MKRKQNNFQTGLFTLNLKEVQVVHVKSIKLYPVLSYISVTYYDWLQAKKEYKDALNTPGLLGIVNNECSSPVYRRYKCPRPVWNRCLAVDGAKVIC